MTVTESAIYWRFEEGIEQLLQCFVYNGMKLIVILLPNFFRATDIKSIKQPESAEIS